MQDNPLRKYYRQVKIFLSLPSQGQFYPPGSIDGDPSKLPVFGMSAMDEIMFKTPDALFSGDATVEVIKSCIPGIKQPWLMPTLDIDAALLSIRIATYGQTLETMFNCTKCNEENKYDLDLSKTLDYFLTLQYESELIVAPFCITFKPLTYKETTEFNMKTYELRRKLYQISENDVSEEEKNRNLNTIYKQIAELTTLGFKKCIKSVEVDDEVVTDQKLIDEWLRNADKEIFDQITMHLKAQSDRWAIPAQTVNCVSCNHENSVRIGIDNTNFFVKR
jgi:transcription elongation factor Elf1